MRLFRARPDSIERKLRHERPQPTDDLIQKISRSVGRHEPRPRWNFALAFALTVAVFTAFALTGGVSYASFAAQKGVKAVSGIAFTSSHTSQSASSPKASGKGNGNGGDHGNGNGGDHGNGGGNGDNQGGTGDHGNGNGGGGHGDNQGGSGDHGNGGGNGGDHGQGNGGDQGGNGDDQGDDDHGPGDDQYKNKVLLCHKPGPHQHTIRVAPSAVPAHLAHGDYLGPCK